MGGKLNVAVNYDSMTITMVGKAEQLDNIMEVLRNASSQPNYQLKL